MTAFIVLASLTVGGKAEDPWESLVAAEQAFSTDSEKRGIKASFLTAFAPEVLTFPPGAPIQKGTRHLDALPDGGGVLKWWPVKAEISASGDFGYTTGPFEFRHKADDPTPLGTGSYSSVWIRKAGGPWKVVADFGYRGPHPSDAKDEPKRPSPRPPEKKSANGTEAGLLAADHAFSTAAEADMAKAYASNLASDARYYRENQKPALGSDAILKEISAAKGKSSWTPEIAGVAKSGDMGYTVGRMKAKPASGEEQHLKYMRIWRAESGKWKVVLEVANAAPAPTT